MNSRLPDGVEEHPAIKTKARARAQINMQLRITSPTSPLSGAQGCWRLRGVMAGGFKSLRGQMLLDGGNLSGSFFHRTVVLICQHDEEGAFGLVLNRPSDNQLGEMLVADLPEGVNEQPVFVGGPVQPSAFSYLVSESGMPEANVMPNLSLGHSLDALVEMSEDTAPDRLLRVFAGYSGWSPGQLESELERGAWLTHPASLDWVFHTPPEMLWKAILRQQGWQQRLLAETPDDPACN